MHCPHLDLQCAPIIPMFHRRIACPQPDRDLAGRAKNNFRALARLCHWTVLMALSGLHPAARGRSSPQHRPVRDNDPCPSLPPCPALSSRPSSSERRWSSLAAPTSTSTPSWV